MKNKFIVISFILIIAVFCAGSIIMPDKPFSENENRYLEPMPTLKDEKILSGEFTEKLNKYVSDNIIFRDALISAKSEIEALCKKAEIGGAYLLKNGGFCEKPENVSQNIETFKNNATAVEEFMKSVSIAPSHKSVMIVPTVSAIYPELLPTGAEVTPQNELMDFAQDNIKSAAFIDVRAAFNKQKAKKELYYKTDHHWTSFSAYTAFSEYMAKIKSQISTEFKEETVTENFKGSLYSKTLLPFTECDKITAFRTKDDKKFTISAENGTKHSIYFPEKLKEKDKYTYFCGNNYPKSIAYGNGKGNLLLIKDSYANCFLPFLLTRYKTVTLIDLRYYRENLKSLMKENKITDILVLYNAESFASEKSVSLINAQ